MRPIERQMLRNQRDIMFWISSKNKSPYDGYFGLRIKETEELLNPIESDEPCCEMPEEEVKSKLQKSLDAIQEKVE